MDVFVVISFGQDFLILSVDGIDYQEEAPHCVVIADRGNRCVYFFCMSNPLMMLPIGLCKLSAGIK